MKTDNEGDYQVSSDGRTVWINNKERCVARLSQRMGEFFLTNKRIEANFDLFVSEAERRCDITVKEHHRPSWAIK